MALNTGLFSKKRLPVLAAILTGFVLGFLVNGALGLIAGVTIGFALRWLLQSRLPVRLTSGMTIFRDSLPILAKLCFFMIFLLPIADYMALPSGHTPDTLPKYISIVAAIPHNLIQKPGTDIYPGWVVIVLISVVLMVWGATNLFKTKNWLLAFAGLVLYTLSPTITGATLGTFKLEIVGAFFGVGYYLAWIGLVLVLVARLLPKFVSSPRLNQAFSMVPPVVLGSLLGQHGIPSLSGHLSFLGSMDFESTHHLIAGGLSGIFAGLGAEEITDDSDEAPEPPTVDLRLTYPAGASPKVFTYGWLFGASCTVNGKDMSDQVTWSGTGTFNPDVGRLSRPNFNAEGTNTIKISITVDGKPYSQSYTVEAKSPALFRGVGDFAFCPTDTHGCPACPHPVSGPIATGSSLVFANGKPAARVGDVGTHAACCGPNTFEIISGNDEVTIEGRPAAWAGSYTRHCGGEGKLG